MSALKCCNAAKLTRLRSMNSPAAKPVNKLQMANQVVAIEKPVSVLNLHVVIAKSHPRADALLVHVNRALKDIKGSGKYGEIIDRHLSAFWNSQGSADETSRNKITIDLGGYT